jgi:hypothetical protein
MYHFKKPREPRLLPSGKTDAKNRSLENRIDRNEERNVLKATEPINCQKHASLREGAHRFATGKQIKLESPTRMMMQPAPNLRPVATWGLREIYVAQDDDKSILPPTIPRQNTWPMQNKREKLPRREPYYPDLRPRTGNGLLKPKKSFEKQEDISRARAQQLCEIFEASDRRDTDLNKMETLQRNKLMRQ